MMVEKKKGIGGGRSDYHLRGGTVLGRRNAHSRQGGTPSVRQGGHLENWSNQPISTTTRAIEARVHLPNTAMRQASRREEGDASRAFKELRKSFSGKYE